jgi:hypothetical protein
MRREAPEQPTLATGAHRLHDRVRDRDPAVLPALDADGAVISDHEVILETVRPASRR